MSNIMVILALVTGLLVSMAYASVPEGELQQEARIAEEIL